MIRDAVDEGWCDYDPADDLRKSVEVAYAAIRARMASGGPGYTPPEPLGALPAASQPSLTQVAQSRPSEPLTTG